MWSGEQPKNSLEWNDLSEYDQLYMECTNYLPYLGVLHVFSFHIFKEQTSCREREREKHMNTYTKQRKHVLYIYNNILSYTRRLYVGSRYTADVSTLFS